MEDEDREILKGYLGENLCLLEEMLNRLSKEKGLRPWERSLPWYQKLLYKLSTLFVVLVYLFICFIVLQLALFNIILLGLMVIYLSKLNDVFGAMIFKAECKY